jgi:hypothetical protein
MKTIEQKQVEVKNYLTKSELHLFKNKKSELFKIIPFEVDGELYVTKITIKSDNTVESKVRKVFKYGSDDLKRTWKDYFFFKSYYHNDEAVSIKHFKTINTFFSYLHGNLTTDDEKNVEYMNKIIDLKKLSLNYVDKPEI